MRVFEKNLNFEEVKKKKKLLFLERLYFFCDCYKRNVYFYSKKKNEIQLKIYNVEHTQCCFSLFSPFFKILEIFQSHLEQTFFILLQPQVFP